MILTPDDDHDERAGDVAREDDGPRDRVPRGVLCFPHLRRCEITETVADQEDRVGGGALGVAGGGGCEPAEAEHEAARPDSSAGSHRV